MLLPLLMNLKMCGADDPEGGTNKRRIHPRYIYEQSAVEEVEPVEVAEIEAPKPVTIDHAKISRQVQALFHQTPVPRDAEEDLEVLLLL